MARVLGPVHHDGCQVELDAIARLRQAEWRDDLPDAVEDFCEVADTRWFTATTVDAAITNALAAWRNGSIPGGAFGLEPVAAHHVKWQYRIGKIAQQVQWHHWCEVELGLALGQIGAEFARLLREDYRWANDCTGGELLFAGNVWRSNFVDLAEFVLDPLAPPLSFTPLHSPVYRTW